MPITTPQPNPNPAQQHAVNAVLAAIQDAEFNVYQAQKDLGSMVADPAHYAEVACELYEATKYLMGLVAAYQEITQQG